MEENYFIYIISISNRALIKRALRADAALLGPALQKGPVVTPDVFFLLLLVSHLRLSQRKDDTVEG